MRGAGAVLVVVTLLASACSDSARPNATSASTPPGAVPSTSAPDDGILRLGVELPLTGPGAPLGLSMKAGVDLAVARINAAGGVNGQPVHIQVADEGADLASATAALDDLASDAVDAVIGPASSTDAIGLMATLRKDNLLACSPSATALSLVDFPDDGWFFRTVPSDALEAQAMARAIDLTGRRNVAILAVDDAYGRPYAEQLATALRSRGMTVTSSIPYTVGSADTTAVAARTAAIGAEVVAVIGDANAGPVAVAAVLQATAGSDVPILVNDAMRGQPAATAFGQLTNQQLARIEGVGPRPQADNQDFVVALHTMAPDVSGMFATNAYDCVNLIALASQSAKSTMSRRIANEMQSVASGGTRCQSFADCANDLAAGRNIDYDGPAGTLDLTTNGEVIRGVFDVFGFEPGGGERPLGTVTVTS